VKVNADSMATSIFQGLPGDAIGRHGCSAILDHARGRHGCSAILDFMDALLFWIS